MIAIEAAGALTPLGTNLTDTMVGLYTHVQLYEDLGVLDDEGEPISGMRIPFVDNLAGPDRMVAMAHAVVDEATLAIEPSAKLPLFLCCPEAASFGQEESDFPGKLLAEVMAKSVVPIDRGQSRVIARGSAGVLEALGTALVLLKDPSIPYCLVGGVDCFVDDVRVEALVDDNRILTVSNKDGFVPGEAGAMLLLTNRPGPAALANWLGAGAGNDEACRGSDLPITGAGLQEAMRRALAQAQVPFEGLDCVAHDFSGEERFLEELLHATSRLARTQGSCVTEDPGLSVGETGAAAAFLAIAMLAFLHSKSVHGGPSMAVLGSDGPERGAVVLGPVQSAKSLK